MPVILSRRALGAGLAGSIVTAAGGHRASAAARIRLRYGTAFPADHPGVTRIQQAAEVIAKETNGAVSLRIFPNGQLGGEADMFSQTRSGALDFMSTSGANQTVVKIGWINVIALVLSQISRVAEPGSERKVAYSASA